MRTFEVLFMKRQEGLPAVRVRKLRLMRGGREQVQNLTRFGTGGSRPVESFLVLQLDFLARGPVIPW